MPGPARKPIEERARGTRGSVATLLPAAGPEGDPPDFPLLAVRAGELSDFINERERVVWADIWHCPQAHAWQQLGWVHNVALYVRLLVRAECGDEKAPAEVRQWSDRLGLTPMAMKRLEWAIADDEVAEQRTTKRPGVDRWAHLIAVDSSAVAGS